MGTRLRPFAEGPAALGSAVLLFAIRFLAPSVSASLGVQGIDTATLDAAVAVFDAALPAVAVFLAAVFFIGWEPARGWDLWYVLTVAAIAASVVFWAGEVDPAARIASGAWSPLPLAVSGTASALAFGVGLDLRMGRADVALRSRVAFRGLYGSFAASYLLGGVRFIDYRVALGSPLPSGLLWLLDYGPTFVPAFAAVGFWLRWAADPRGPLVESLRALGPPVAGAAIGVGLAQGLGGFILSNVLAWGGGYEIFTPTSVSLALVGFSVGAFAATAWRVRGRTSAGTWRLAFGGAWVAALAGVGFFGQALASLAGILLGLTLAARSLLVPQVPRT